jgi:hypothetical protein
MGLETIGAYAALAGAGIAAYGMYESGQGQAEAARASAAAYRQKARLSRLEKREAAALTDYRVRLIHEEGAEVLGAIEAETAKSGLALTGTPLASLVDTARQVELAAAVEKRAGRVTARRWEQEIEANESGSTTGQTAAGYAERAGVYGALGELLSIGRIPNLFTKAK